MTFEYNQGVYWDGATYYPQNLDTVPLEGGEFFDPSTQLTIDSSNQQYNGNVLEDINGTYSDWDGSIRSDTISTRGYSPATAKSEKTASTTEGSSRGPRRPSAEAIARRRKQNRVSQAAWRARNKELVEELRQEISEYSEYTENMQQTMKSLLQTTECLKGAIKTALAQQPPRKSSNTGVDGEVQLMSPTLTAEELPQDIGECNEDVA